ncbi:hypothetical protein BJ508DRAFT_335959 [Ascobolus immersus RN42]|uniref:Uncharacterized protein n=1 Tax=Ascobolus immersus RN42 TaxID=1160509 RepID=A0A3N4HAD1_ASCIM|nr:hypothetical protein BJ508DRAFT_335959 [Ascobolus immersus RN42]
MPPQKSKPAPAPAPAATATPSSAATPAEAPTPPTTTSQSALPILTIADDQRITVDENKKRWIDGQELSVAARTRLSPDLKRQIKTIMDHAQSSLKHLSGSTGQSLECIMNLAKFYQVDLNGSDLRTGKRRKMCPWNVFQNEVCYQKGLVPGGKPTDQAEFEEAAADRAVAYAAYIQDPKNLKDLQKRAHELNTTSAITTDTIRDRERKRFLKDVFTRAVALEAIGIESLIFISDGSKANGGSSTGSAVGCAYDEHTLGGLGLGSDMFHSYVRGKEFHKRVGVYKAIRAEGVLQACGNIAAQARAAREKKERAANRIPEPEPAKKLSTRQQHRQRINQVVCGAPDPPQPNRPMALGSKSAKSTSISDMRSRVCKMFYEAVGESWYEGRRLPKASSCVSRLAEIGKKWNLPEGVTVADYYGTITKAKLAEFQSWVNGKDKHIIDMTEAEKAEYDALGAEEEVAVDVEGEPTQKPTRKTTGKRKRSVTTSHQEESEAGESHLQQQEHDGGPSPNQESGSTRKRALAPTITRRTTRSITNSKRIRLSTDDDDMESGDADEEGETEQGFAISAENLKELEYDSDFEDAGLNADKCGGEEEEEEQDNDDDEEQAVDGEEEQDTDNDEEQAVDDEEEHAVDDEEERYDNDEDE